MLNHQEVEEYILRLPDAKLDYPFGKGVAVYKANGKMFALITENKSPIQLSLKCDPELSLLLREKYESVMPGQHLNKNHWNTILLSGQLSWDEIQALIHHSYDLVRQVVK